MLGALSAEEEAFLDASETRKVRRDQEEKERLHREREVAEKNRQLLLDSYIERGQRLVRKERAVSRRKLWLHRAYQGGSKNLTLPDLLKARCSGSKQQRECERPSAPSKQRRNTAQTADASLQRVMIRTARVWDAHTGKLCWSLLVTKARSGAPGTARMVGGSSPQSLTMRFGCSMQRLGDSGCAHRP